MTDINLPIAIILGALAFAGVGFYCGYHYGWAAAAKKLNNDPENL